MILDGQRNVIIISPFNIFTATRIVFSLLSPRPKAVASTTFPKAPAPRTFPDVTESTQGNNFQRIFNEISYSQLDFVSSNAPFDI